MPPKMPQKKITPVTTTNKQFIRPYVAVNPYADVNVEGQPAKKRQEVASFNPIPPVYISQDLPPTIASPKPPVAAAAASALIAPKFQMQDGKLSIFNEQEVTDTFVAAIMQKINENPLITKLSIIGCKLSSNAIEVIANALSSNTTLIQINLIGVSMDDDGATLLANALCLNQTLLCLDVSNNEICYTGAKDLLAVANNHPKLQLLDIRRSGRNIDEESGTELEGMARTGLDVYINGGYSEDDLPEYMSDAEDNSATAAPSTPQPT